MEPIDSMLPTEEATASTDCRWMNWFKLRSSDWSLFWVSFSLWMKTEIVEIMRMRTNTVTMRKRTQSIHISVSLSTNSNGIDVYAPAAITKHAMNLCVVHRDNRNGVLANKQSERV